MVFGINVLNRIRRNNDSVCYAPSRAKLPDPSIGSYKLIQPKEDPPSRPRLAPMADLLFDNENKNKINQDYPNIEYFARKTCEKLLNVPLEYSKKYPNEINLNPPQNGSLKYEVCKENNETVSDTHSKESNTLENSESVNDVHINNEPNQEDNSKIEREESPSVQEESVVIEEVVDSSDESEEEVETVVELPESTRWWETVPSLQEFLEVRDKVLQVLPNDIEIIRRLTSLTHMQRSPIDFIRDFFGTAPPSADDLQRPNGGAIIEVFVDERVDVKGPSLKQLMSDLLRISKRLVAELEEAASQVARATATNEQLGAQVLSQLTDPLSTKFTSHHTEVYHISSLMAALSARLARTYDEKGELPQEQLNELATKQKKLQDQLVEARSLKENIDARASLLAAKISHVLNPELYHSYRLFMAVKPRLIIRAKHLQYRIEYEKERLASLQKILNNQSLM